MDLSSLRVKDLTEICRNFGASCISQVQVIKLSSYEDAWYSLFVVVVGIRTSGRKAELVERIKANATYQADVAALAKMGISNGHAGGHNGTKRGPSHTVREICDGL